ncbi:MAG: GTP-binding protein [Proteobacteria bacterium]|nr:GTP-binding protein [Pseudomonadota bacterium]NBX86755.1 GTP-binding protein [Pseudomonadota bacterium]
MKTPVTVITGFLGAGKTTLLNRILTENHGQKYAVIINEYGEAGIDDKLITAQVDEEIFEMNNGCICCTVRGDLIRIINLLIKKADKFDAILVETTGLANPAPVAQTFFADATVRARTTLDSILTVVDAAHIEQQLQTSPEAAEQIAFADTILLNKAESVNAEKLQAAQAAIRSLNSTATIHPTTRSNAPLSQILHRHAFNLEKIEAIAPTFLADAETGHHHHHTSGISSLSLSTEKPVDADKFDDWMSQLLATQGQNLLRTKGILNVHGEPNRYVFQAVHMMSEGLFTTPWQAGETRQSNLVFIGKNLNKIELKQNFLNCIF